MKHDKKQSAIGIASLMLICVASLTGCSKSGNSWIDDPEDVYEYTWEEYLKTYTLNASELAGTWTLEKVEDISTGKVTEINETFTILPFDLNAAEETYVSEVNYANLQIHFADYDDKVVYKKNGEEILEDLLLYLIGKKGDPISKSRVYMLTFSVDKSDNASLIIGLNNIEYSKGKASAYGVIQKSGSVDGKFTYDYYNGEVTLTKK